MSKLRVFISSVQKELELERAAVASLISTDPFLLQHCVPVRHDKEPPTGRPAEKAYLDSLKSCQIYLLLVDVEYGRLAGDLSATHEEYREAQKAQLPTLVFIRGLDARRDEAREAKTKAFIGEVKRDGYKYDRFHDREDLKLAVRSALRAVLEKEFHFEASEQESADGERMIEMASPFESAILRDVPAGVLDQELLDLFNQRIAANTAEKVFRSGELALEARGLAVSGGVADGRCATAGAFILFAPRPADRFPQCELLVDAYDEKRISGRPKGQANINAPLPRALEQVLKFVDDHTFHPRRVVGLNNVRLDEYPAAALREALLNAVAHRSYDDASRKVFVRLFSDRLEVASPGYPLKPLTVAKLRKGGYRPCSRNPMIAQTLATIDRMEQRGTGFARMRDAMLNHGLDEPRLELQDGFFVVTLPGPAGDYDRIKTPVAASGPVTPAVEARLNRRQKRMAALLAAGEVLTSRRCEKAFHITRDTAARDFAVLQELGIAIKLGKGRSVRYAQPQER